MTKYVILGHGVFDPGLGVGPPEILVPTGTKLQFYADAGQALVLPPPDSKNAPGYEKVADVWRQLQAESSPLGAKGVAYNFKLSPDASEEHRKSAQGADWGGAQLIFVSSGDTYLCRGSELTCPTPILNVVASRHDELDKKGADFPVDLLDLLEGNNAVPDEVKKFLTERLDVIPAERPELMDWVIDGVPVDRWEHHCDGILGKYGGGGNELYWIACTSISIGYEGKVWDEDELEEVLPEAVRALPVLDAADVSGPGADDVSQWLPGGKDASIYHDKNLRNLDLTPNNKTVSIVAGGEIVLIGPDHDRMPADYARRQNDTKMGAVSPSKAFKAFKVTGLPSAKQEIVEKELRLLKEGWSIKFEPDETA